MSPLDEDPQADPGQTLLAYCHHHIYCNYIKILMNLYQPAYSRVQDCLCFMKFLQIPVKTLCIMLLKQYTVYIQEVQPP